MTTTCPFCGAAPKENWTKKVRWFTCGTMVGPDNTRHDQTIHCMTDEVARLTRERDEARTEVARLKAGGCARDQRTTQWCAEAVALQERVKRLEREVELLRAYGNKDCTWMADQHLESEKAKEAKP